MTFVERFRNTVGFCMLVGFWNLYSITPFNEVAKKHFGTEFPDVRALISNAPLVFVNSDELFDIPRPILHKIIYIGGLDMKKPKPLTKVFTVFFIT